MFCKNFKTKIKALINQFNRFVNANVETALKVSSSLKSILDSLPAQILTAIIPGDVDEAVRVKIVAALEKIVPALSIVDACKQYNDLEDKLKCFAEQLNKIAPELRDAILSKLAALLASELDDQRLAQNLYDLYTQGKYSTSK